MAILDGGTLKDWLRKNKQVKIVTRDRASAYAAAIKEILPDAMQVADRFHLHQNLLEAVKNTVNSMIPVDVKIPIDSNENIGVESEPDNRIAGKKMPCIVDNYAEYNPKSAQLYNAIHEYDAGGIHKESHC